MKIIYRMSCVTRKILARDEMFRIVKTKDKQIVVDNTYKLQGRGAYLEKDKDIILTAQKKRVLSRALKTEVLDETYIELLKLL